MTPEELYDRFRVISKPRNHLEDLPRAKKSHKLKVALDMMTDIDIWSIHAKRVYRETGDPTLRKLIVKVDGEIEENYARVARAFAELVARGQ